MKKAAFPFLSAVLLMFIFSSCSSWWHPRWHSTYKTKVDGKEVTKHDHYDPYKLKWYKKNWKNRSIWK